jgi:hypothetical protein
MTNADLDALVRLCELELACAELLVRAAGVRAGMAKEDLEAADDYWSRVQKACGRLRLQCHHVRKSIPGYQE